MTVWWSNPPLPPFFHRIVVDIEPWLLHVAEARVLRQVVNRFQPVRFDSLSESGSIIWAYVSTLKTPRTKRGVNLDESMCRFDLWHCTMRSVSIDDLSPLGPPISNGAGRVYILNSVAVFVFVAAYTTRPLFLTRLSTALLAGNIYLLLTMPDILGHIPGLDPLIANFVVAWWMRAVDLFFLRDESRVLAKKYAHDGDDDRRAPRFELMTPTRAFDYLVVNHRLIGTPYQARGIQPFDKSRPHWTPTRTQFLRLKLNHLLISYLTLDLLVTQQPAPPARLFARDQEFFFSRLHEVTLEELSFRWLTHFNLWASCTCLIQYIYAIVAIIGVGSSLYEPGDFPPLLGDIREETSVRNHWG